MEVTENTAALRTTGRVIHWAFWYDVLLKVISLGRERAFREKMLDIAGLAPGDVVLDAGCGTGTLAIGAKQRTGPTGAVYGIDASPRMVARARRKAAKAGLEISLQPALLEAIPFPDGKFDVLTTSLVMHHLPADLLPRCLAEMRRVLRPGGRLVVFDFGGSDAHHWHWRKNDPHHAFKLDGIMPTITAAGFKDLERGKTGIIRGIMFVRAIANHWSAPRIG
jgi:ubiquinone/menaquinone biosynthesis C-methylase UbiE